MFENLIDDSSEDPKQHVSLFTKTLLECATTCGHNASKKMKIRNENNAPWFDTECINLKNSLKGLSKNLKHNPHNNNIRESLYIKKRE